MKIVSPTKWWWWWWGVYTMENKDAKTDYQEVVRVGDQKWETVEITIRIIFFVWDSYSLFLYKQRIFKSDLKKITHTQRTNSHPKSQYDLSPYYINLLKNGSIPPLHHPGGGGDANYEIPLDMSMYFFSCNKTVETIMLKCL